MCSKIPTNVHHGYILLNSQIATYYDLAPQSFCVHVCKGTLAIATEVDQNIHENSGCVSQVLAPRQYLLHSSHTAFFVYPCSSNQRYVPPISSMYQTPLFSALMMILAPIFIYSGSGTHRHSHIISGLAIKYTHSSGNNISIHDLFP